MVLPRAAAGVIVQQQQDAFFLMDTEGGEVFRVNETAARIFELCRSGSTLDDAVQALAGGRALRRRGMKSLRTCGVL
ncbi:PqqD family protein [Pyxidicoccus sp. MSG2]|uniref:PqqD family protein n=1 Tax=Pyxidicoccus sp. MSG2 TaxID=2996790 RepID=UPI002272287B|nr:PqqD family protein [Pyxidicoccus sp. MSG2]MCY1014621.1 PqqD family protein [Pyxidicoccus sp. MSG2]